MIDDYTLTVISSPSDIVRRIQQRATALHDSEGRGKVLEAASIAEAQQADNMPRPCAYVVFEGIQPANIDPMEPTQGAYFQDCFEEWLVVIFTADTNSRDSGAAAQRQAIAATESVMRSLINWTPPTTDGAPGQRRQPCHLAASDLHDENGARIAAAVRIRVPNRLTPHDGFDDDADALQTVDVRTPEPTATHKQEQDLSPAIDNPA